MGHRRAYLRYNGSTRPAKRASIYLMISNWKSTSRKDWLIMNMQEQRCQHDTLCFIWRTSCGLSIDSIRTLILILVFKSMRRLTSNGRGLTGVSAFIDAIACSPMGLIVSAWGCNSSFCRVCVWAGLGIFDRALVLSLKIDESDGFPLVKLRQPKVKLV